MSNEKKVEVIVDTIEEAVEWHREGLWLKVYQIGTELLQQGNDEEALKKFTLCLTIDSSRTETYLTHFRLSVFDSVPSPPQQHHKEFYAK